MNTPVQVAAHGFCVTILTSFVVSFATGVSAETQYVTPLSQCVENSTNESCLTLSQVANDTERYFTDNTTLILLPGEHILDSELVVENIANLEIFATFNNSTVECNQSKSFSLHNISHLHIVDIDFYRCAFIQITNVEQFTLDNCDFNGEGASILPLPPATHMSGLHLYSVFSAIVRESSFSMFDAHSYNDGGVLSTFSCNKVFISNCVFEYNAFSSVYANDTDITVYGTRFHDNTHTDAFSSYGTAISINSPASELKTLWVFESSFINNTAECGGAIYTRGVNVMIHNSRFECNGAKNGNGGALSVSNSTNTTINNTTFNNNKAFELFGRWFDRDGGAIHAVFSNITILNSTFNSNRVEHNSLLSYSIGSSQGGAMYLECCDLTIENTSFVNNVAIGMYELTSSEGGALYLLSGRVNITTSTFKNNVVTGSERNLGGAISFNKCSDCDLIINQCVFINNKADGGASIHVLSGNNVAVQDSSFVGNIARQFGGAIYGQSLLSLSLIRTNFVNNTLNKDPDFNGVIFLIQCHSFTSDISLNVENNQGVTVSAINSNIKISGDTNLSNNCGSFVTLYSNVIFQGNTNFLYNGGQHCTNQIEGVINDGATVFAFQSNVVFEGRANFTGNKAEMGGAITALESKIYIHGDISVSHNSAWLSGGGIYAYQSELNFMGTTSITNNIADDEGGGIYASSSTIRLIEGVLYFSRNHAKRGGGMFLQSNTKLYIIDTILIDNSAREPWQLMTFTNNFADYGGAIYVDDKTYSGVCGGNINSFATTCFYQTFLYSSDDVNSNEYTIYFSNNMASISGESLYGGLVDRCTLSHYVTSRPRIGIVHSTPANLTKDTTNEYASNYILNDIPSFEPTIASDPVRVCFCNGDQPDCSYQPDTVRVRKGERFVLPVVAVDQVGRPTASRIHSSLQSQGGTFSERQLLQNTSENCTELEYNILSPRDFEQLLLYAEGPCRDIGISQRSINVTFLPCDCPIGFERSNVTQINCSCDCHSTLKPFIVNCFIETKSVLRQGDFWITYIIPTSSDSSSEGYVIHPNCPYDYCHPPSKSVLMNLNDSNRSDAQCAFNRSGVLCGSCQEGLSLSLGSSRCMPCSNHWLALLIPFAIAGIALVAFLLVLNLTVAVGTMNGMIFYANIIAANSAVFFPFEKSHFLTFVISWLNLDFGFETCFYDGMDGYAKVWLQLAFPLYVITLVAMVIIFGDWIIIRKQRSKLLTKYSPKMNPVATLATLILLSYTKLLRTIIAALSFTTLEYPDGSHKMVWLYDANVPYAEGKHIPLIIAASLILLVGLVYTILLFFWQWLLKFPSDSILKWITEHSTVADTAHTRIRNTRLYTLYNRMYSSLYSFMDTYHAPYNFKHRYWTGLLLLVRVLLYIVASFKHINDHPNINLLVIIVVTGALLCLCQSVYKQWPLNILVTSFLFNLLTFSAGTLYLRETNGNQAALAYTSVTIAYITLLGILIYHIVTFMLNKCLQSLKVNVKNSYHTKRESVSVEHKGPCLNDVQNCCTNEQTNERIVPMTEFDGLPRKESATSDSSIHSIALRSSVQC